jgi:hypothetical protein
VTDAVLAAIVGGLTGVVVAALFSWWFDRRTRWLEQRRAAYLKFLFALDDFLGSLPEKPPKNAESLRPAGHTLYRAFEEFRIVAPAKGHATVRGHLSYMAAVLMARDAHEWHQLSPKQWTEFREAFMAARGHFFDAIRHDLGLPDLPDEMPEE